VGDAARATAAERDANGRARDLCGNRSGRAQEEE
jgi:hypothetical protein